MLFRVFDYIFRLCFALSVNQRVDRKRLKQPIYVDAQYNSLVQYETLITLKHSIVIKLLSGQYLKAKI